MALLSYHWRSLFVRKTSTVLTILVVAAVVAVLTWMSAFSAAMQSSLAVAGDVRKLIVLREGATAESNSAIPVDDFNKLAQVNGVARFSGTGEALLSPELMVQVALPRIRDGGKTTANVAVRGVTEKAFEIHKKVRLLDRTFSKGEPEVIVGLSAAKQFAGLNIGDTLRLGYGGDRDYKVVGHFSAEGGPLESEIWAYLPSLMNSYGRTMYSSAYLTLAEGIDAKSVVEQIRGPAIQLAAATEAQYWQDQSGVLNMYQKIALIFVVAMCMAAVFAIANTFFAFVAGRTREIAMLRTIGFPKTKIMIGFLTEAVMLSLVGGLVGVGACMAWLRIAGNTKDMFGGNTFTTLAFEIRLSGQSVLWSLLSVLGVGLLGACWPAGRAARIQVISALREP